jgi:ribose transport system permease protein
VALWLVLAIVAVFAMRRTIFGRTLYIISNNQVASFLSGIRVKRTLIVAFIVSSVCNAIAGNAFPKL